MAFPTSPVLDNFNTGAGTTTLTVRAGGWGATALGPSSTSAQTNATPTNAGSATICGNFWTLAFADSEVFTTMVTWTPATDTFQLCGRITATGASPTYYCLELATSVATDFTLFKVVAGTKTSIQANIATTVSAGDGIGLACIGTTISTYYKSGAGAWVQKHSVVDSSISAAGSIGFRNLFGITFAIDDFGGGAPGSLPTNRSKQIIVRRTRSGA